MISLLLVNYRSSALAARAVASARAATSAALEVVIVDNSVDAAEAAALRACEPDALIVSETNRGYAGAINLGRRSCHGETLLLSNPDVVFSAGSIDLLSAALVGNVAVSGPALFWDEAHQWRLPPADAGSGLSKLDEVLASRASSWARERDRRRIRRRVAFWSLTRPAAVEALSGAVLAVRAADFDAAEGFDERFALYFEEIDFLRRIRERRRRVLYVPEARVRHAFNQSARQVAGEAARRYAESELKYLEKWNGPFAARLLKWLERPAPDSSPVAFAGPLALPPGDLVVEASPLASFATAAGHFPTGPSVTLPPEVRASLGDAPVYVRVVDRRTGAVHPLPAARL